MFLVVDPNTMYTKRSIASVALLLDLPDVPQRLVLVQEQGVLMDSLVDFVNVVHHVDVVCLDHLGRFSVDDHVFRASFWICAVGVYSNQDTIIFFCCAIQKEGEHFSITRSIVLNPQHGI